MYTLEGNVKNLFQKKYKFDIKTKSFAMSCMLNPSNSITSTYDYDINLAVPSCEKIKYKFISTNLRYTPTRHILVSYLYDKSSLLSFTNNVDFADSEIFHKQKNKDFWNNIFEIGRAHV